MTLLTEGLHAGEFLVSEANYSRSREQVTVLSGQNLLAGAVLGRGGNAQAAAPIPAVTGAGNGVMTKLRFGPDVQAGSYLIQCITAVAHGGVFSVTAPDSTVLDNFTMTPGAGGTTAYSSSHLSFSVTDGSSDFTTASLFTVTVTAAGTPVVVGTGNGAMSAISLGPLAEVGTYRAEASAVGTHAATWTLFDPDGNQVGLPVAYSGSGAAAAFVNDHVNFTITDGSTDFAAGDYFNIVVVGGVDKAAAWSPAATDGTQNVAGILWAAVDASAGDLEGVIIARDAEVNWSELSWAAGISAGEKASARTALAALGIIGR